jgi:hypothetical protein
MRSIRLYSNSELVDPGVFESDVEPYRHIYMVDSSVSLMDLQISAAVCRQHV